MTPDVCVVSARQSHVGSVGRCAVDNTTCVTPDRHSRRRLVNDQIHRLKQLLKQLKVSPTADGAAALAVCPADEARLVSYGLYWCRGITGPHICAPA